jgi:lipopolysaccharide export system protein LptC
MRARHTAYQFYPLVIVALLAAGSVWLERLTRDAAPPPAAVSDSMPDFAAATVRITGFAHDGSLRYTLDSPHLTHLPQSDITLAETPYLRLFAHGRETWLQAGRGEVSAGGERVDFSGAVELERESGEGDAGNPGEPLRFVSEQLRVWPQDQRAATDTPVHITQADSTATADGLAASNIFGNLELIGHARVSFPRHRRNSR